MENYCTECIYRQERVYRNKKGKPQSIKTNVKNFCSLGYTQNPMTKEAAQNVIKNNGEICAKARQLLDGLF